MWIALGFVGVICILGGGGFFMGVILVALSAVGMAGSAFSSVTGAVADAFVGKGKKKKKLCPCGSGKKFKKCHGAPGIPPRPGSL